MSVYKRKNSITNGWLITLILVVFALMIGVGITFAWFTDLFNDEGEATIGEVGIEIYNGDTKINSEVLADGTLLAATSLTVNLPGELNTTLPYDLKVKNTGNIPGIVRCLFVITTDDILYDHEGNLVGGAYNIVPMQQLTIGQTGWVVRHDNELLNDQYFYNAFLNSQLEGGADVQLLTGLTPIVDGLQGRTLHIFVRAEIVAYSGNAYQVDTPENPVEDKDKPFGVLPADFLNNTWTAWKLNP
ncbi:MAG: hypothetical protein IKB42_02135 [Clostridia bacterium]|nr:hypothetical protein [Clostridia bacterium]